ncbi:hypothetical protein B0H14DRAFT_2772277 [Mycena olivaceomarginata]|nr:hypothetical protein B0H14DRAFT_2772277 [Mycena olivaceomarginata]
MEKKHSIPVGPAKFNFNRTLRVPDNASNYALPPGLGTFPIAKAQDYENTLPAHIKQRGGYLMVFATGLHLSKSEYLFTATFSTQSSLDEHWRRTLRNQDLRRGHQCCYWR